MMERNHLNVTFVMPALPGNQFEENMLNQLMKERNLLNVTFVMPALPENQFEATC